MKASLKDYQLEDGGYEDEDGCFRETSEDLIQCGMLGFCGCGAPWENLEFIRGALAALADDKDRIACVDAYFNKFDAMRGFFFYWADKEGLTEHGGSVSYGGWLSADGEALLNLLNEHKKLQGEVK